MPTSVSGDQFRNALLLIALAGVLLLLAREWPVRLAGVVLMLPRLLFARLTGAEWLLVGAGVIAAVGRLVYRWRRRSGGATRAGVPAPDAPEPDDVSEAAPCPSCGGSIPAGADRCPACGWSYQGPGE